MFEAKWGSHQSFPFPLPREMPNERGETIWGVMCQCAAQRPRRDHLDKGPENHPGNLLMHWQWHRIMVEKRKRNTDVIGIMAS